MQNMDGAGFAGPERSKRWDTTERKTTLQNLKQFQEKAKNFFERRKGYGFGSMEMLNLTRSRFEVHEKREGLGTQEKIAQDYGHDLPLIFWTSKFGHPLTRLHLCS